MHDHSLALEYGPIELGLEDRNREPKRCRAPKPANEAQPGAYVLLIGAPHRTAPARVALHRRRRGLTQHSAPDVRRARRLLASLQYDAIALFWDDELCAADLEELGERAGATSRLVFMTGASRALEERVEALGWTVAGARTPAQRGDAIEELLRVASRVRLSPATPHYRVPGFGHIDLRPVVKALVEARRLTPTQATVLASRLACWPMDKRLGDLGCSRRLIERYEGELREGLGLREVTLWLITGLEILAKQGRLGEVGFGQGRG